LVPPAAKPYPPRSAKKKPAKKAAAIKAAARTPAKKRGPLSRVRNAVKIKGL
jgi:hypothetical protein